MSTDKKKTRPHQIEIRDPDDELVTHSRAHVHIERMGEGHWWMRVSVGDEDVDINFTSETRINSRMERGR